MFTCPSCYREFDGVIYHDKLGTHTVCPKCDSSFNVDYPQPTTERTIAGYKIISSISISGTDEIVMGSMDTSFGTKFVTWQCSNRTNCNFGHYFMSFDEARNDMIYRAAESCRIPVRKPFSGLSEYIKRTLRIDCELSDAQIENIGRFEALDAILKAEGIIGYAYWIKDLVEDIFNVSLD